MISDRQRSILYAAIEVYIKRAQPVSSAGIAEEYDFALSPATLRNEFSELETAGYLTQPHTSAGRVPTDKGYRFFVDELTSGQEQGNRRAREILQKIIKMRMEEYVLFAELARTLADLSGNAVFSGRVGGPAFFKSGIHEVLSQPELEDMEFRKSFGDVIDSFEEHVDSLIHTLKKNHFSVFIGKENPVANARGFSMMVSRCSTPFSEDGVVVIFGPKRMDYRRNLSLLDALTDLME